MTAKKTSVVTEFGIFAIGLPLIIGIVAAMFSATLSNSRQTPPPVMGISRGLFITVPILGTCAISMVFGILLLITRKVWAVVGCIIAGGLIALSYIVVFTILAGPPINLITAVLIAGPVLLYVRSSKAIAEINNASAPPAVPSSLSPVAPPPLPPSAQN